MPLDVATLIGVACVAAAVAIVVLRRHAWIYSEDIWSIAVYTGDQVPLEGRPDSADVRQVLTASDVSDARAVFVADPFLVRHDNGWLMFFEAMDGDLWRGVLAVARSADAKTWRYDRIVLKESFHLSYPQVINCDGAYFMIPESGAANEVRLYGSSDFPYSWRYQTTLLRGAYRDATVFRWDDRWWMFAQSNEADLELHYADTIDGPWKPHPCSPLRRNDPRTSRPAGRVWTGGDAPVRFAQDCRETYGGRVVAFRIEDLTPESYRETELPESPILVPGTQSWNRDGMHHIDIQCDQDGKCIALIDGKFIAHRISGRRFLADLKSGFGLLHILRAGR